PKPRPAGNGQSRPAGQSKPASGQARPAQQERTGSGGTSGQQNASRQSKNFIAEDDEFDFEYLNWDGEEDN
ncbi:MAG: hypothetical protein K2I21_11945, partial [Acetatifactor sp.]|nr:hypothetical protein [Acetatifactor sp.]